MAAEHENAIVEPAAPNKSRARKKKDVQKEKCVEIREVIPEAGNSPLIPSGDKGKEVLEDPSPPVKRQKMMVTPEPRQEPSALEADL